MPPIDIKRATISKQHTPVYADAISMKKTVRLLNLNQEVEVHDIVGNRASINPQRNEWVSLDCLKFITEESISVF